VAYVRADAECPPFPDTSFDRVTIGFGLRNVTHQERALEAMRRVLRPGGCALILEFSSLYVRPLQPLYDFYSFRALPAMGRLVARDADSYRYLAESIRMHPDQETLKGMMENAGFEDCDYLNLSGGIVAIHRGYVY
jgi:demethylmenaquinone methyltransferase/2-methoxy-6-polyprenyl-1,4-benzoquinol methylase